MNMPSDNIEFEDVEIDKDRQGRMLSASAYCPVCRFDRTLKVNEFAGGYGLRCRTCLSGQTVYVRKSQG
jgi:hypothetical protein